MVIHEHSKRLRLVLCLIVLVMVSDKIRVLVCDLECDNDDLE